MSDPVRINGNMFSWASIRLKVDGDVFSGFTSISYSDKRERVKGYGMGRHYAPRGRTSGKYSTESVKLAGPKGTMQELRTALAMRSPDGRSYGNVEFEIAVQFVEAGEIPIHDSIERCVYVGTTTSHEESPDPLKEEIEIDCMLIRRNGLVLFDETQGSP